MKHRLQAVFAAALVAALAGCTTSGGSTGPKAQRVEVSGERTQGQLYLNAEMQWGTEMPDVLVAEYDGETRSGVPDGNGTGYFYGELELCEGEEADEVEETDPELIEGLCIEPGRETAMYDGEWRGGLPWDGTIAATEAEAVITQGKLNIAESAFEEEDDDD